MNTPIADRSRWWGVIAYEVSMFRWAISISVKGDPLLANGITETKILHTRNLCDFCTSTRPNDIKPSDLFDGYDTHARYKRLRELTKLLNQEYGKSGRDGDARWTFNKMLAHPSKERGLSFDYTSSLQRVVPVLNDIIHELEILRACSSV